MCIIIYYSNTIDFPFVFIASVGTRKFGKSLLDGVASDSQQVGQGYGRHGVVNIMLAGDHKGKVFANAAFPVEEKGRPGQFVITDLRTGIIAGGGSTVCDHFA